MRLQLSPPPPMNLQGPGCQSSGSLRHPRPQAARTRGTCSRAIPNPALDCAALRWGHCWVPRSSPVLTQGQAKEGARGQLSSPARESL